MGRRFASECKMCKEIEIWLKTCFNNVKCILPEHTTNEYSGSTGEQFRSQNWILLMRTANMNHSCPDLLSLFGPWTNYLMYSRPKYDITAQVLHSPSAVILTPCSWNVSVFWKEEYGDHWEKGTDLMGSDLIWLIFL